MAALDEIIRKLEAARGDVRAQAVITADFALAVHPTKSRVSLQAALDAAAVLRWFDVPLLAWMLAIDNAEAGEIFGALTGLPFVERFPSREGDMRNVHEATRLGWRLRLARDKPENWRALSARAASWFSPDASASGRVEWIYHLLSADPDAGAAALEELNRVWASTARPEDEQAMALALGELEESGLATGRARVEILLYTAEVRASRGEVARLGGEAETALKLARSVNYQSGLAHAYSLSGDVYAAQGKLEEARAAFAENLAISRRLVKQDPGNAGRQRDLAIAHSRVATGWQGTGKLEKAKAALAKSLAVSRRLVEEDPNNAGWRCELAVTHTLVGDVLQAEGKLKEAESAFAESLEINRRLVEQDPSNAGWQDDLALAHGRVGGILRAQGKLEEAQAAFAESLALCRQLAGQDPSNASWQRGLASAHSRMGEVLLAQGKLKEAESAFAENFAISRQLAQQDPADADSLHELATAHNKMGRVMSSQGNMEAAQSAYAEEMAIGRILSEQDPNNTGWRRDFAIALWNYGSSTWDLGQKQNALPFYREAKEIFDYVIKTAPGFLEWQQDRDLLSERLTDLEAELAAGGQAPIASTD